jgi:dihydrofolate reductase
MTANESKTIKIYLIAAVGLRGELGKGLDIPWMGETPEDMRFFQKKSKEIGTILMGYNTYLSLPKALKDRRCLVLTSNPIKVDREDFHPVNSFDEAIEHVKDQGTDLAIVGGASIYLEALKRDIVDEAFINHILYPFDGCDIFFPMELLASGNRFRTESIKQVKSVKYDIAFTHLIRNR